jgi:hypothetical protein
MGVGVGVGAVVDVALTVESDRAHATMAALRRKINTFYGRLPEEYSSPSGSEDNGEDGNDGDFE